MKTILVDAVECLVSDQGELFKEMQTLLDSFENRKIILTNANEAERDQFGLTDVPYEVFSLDHNPSKIDSKYYQKMLLHFSLMPHDVVYFEHDEKAVESARAVGIETHHYDAEKKDLVALEEFLRAHV